MKSRLCFRAEVAPEVTPEVPVLPVLPVFTAEVPPRRVSQSAVGALILVGRTGAAGICAQRPDFWATYLRGLSSPMVL